MGSLHGGSMDKKQNKIENQALWKKRIAEFRARWSDGIRIFKTKKLLCFPSSILENQIFFRRC
jgi:hypothetical protein